MDLSDIRKLDKVVDRLKAAGPSGVAPPHCWFCGKIEAWFRCDCKDAIEAQQGKRNKPRWVEKGGKSYIILDPDVIAREHNQRRKRYEPPEASGKPPVPTVPGVQKGAAGIEPKRREVDHVKESAWLAENVITPAVDTPVHAEPETAVGVDTSAPPSVDSVDNPPIDPRAARRAYKAEHERQRRARAKDQP